MMLKYKCLALFAGCALSMTAFAQESAPPSAAVPAPASVPSKQEQPKATVAPPNIPASLIKMGRLHAKYEKFYPKAWESPFPGVEDTLFDEKGGIRDAMAKHNFGILFLDTSAFYYNLRQPPMYQFPAGSDSSTEGGNTEEVFMGQRPTFQSTEMAWLTYVVPHHNVQIVASYANINTNWDQSGPTLFRLDNLMATWWDAKDRIEITLGYIENDSTNFYEGYIGGSLAGGTLGVQAAIPYILGESRTGTSTPGINTKVKLSKYTYDRLGFQRSVDSAGALEEHHRNPRGFRFLESGEAAKLLTIDELGYHRPASYTQKSVLVRATGFLNNSNFTDYKHYNSTANCNLTGQAGCQDDNFAASFAGDFQLTQPDKILGFRGWYAGGSAQYAPPRLNLYSQYYEARLYGMGPFSRNHPEDMPILMGTHTVFSQMALNDFTSGNVPAHSYGDQTTVSLGYSWRVRAGMWVCPNVTYSRHPTWYPSFLGPRLQSPVNAVMNFTWML